MTWKTVIDELKKYGLDENQRVKVQELIEEIITDVQYDERYNK